MSKIVVKSFTALAQECCEIQAYADGNGAFFVRLDKRGEWRLTAWEAEALLTALRAVMCGVRASADPLGSHSEA